MQMSVRILVLLIVLVVAPSLQAHHSYAMYDGTRYRVFTGVVVRIVPNAAHFEIHFVPLNEQRDLLVRDDKGQPQVWIAQMESAPQAFADGVTKESFPQGTVFSIGLHPRRDGALSGDRGDSGLFQCAKGSKPAPGKHCDSVAGARSFGKGVLPPEGPS